METNVNARKASKENSIGLSTIDKVAVLSH